MTFVFYDTETTGIDTYYDQIVQFGAIQTDDGLNELERYDVRIRIQPHIIPSPFALHINGLTPADVNDPLLPSHFEAVKSLHRRIVGWSPSLFFGYNSIEFDEILLRQAFYQTLLPIFLTNIQGNKRGDVLRMVRAYSILRPDALRIPLTKEGRQTFGLDRLARENGFCGSRAHEALSDSEATIHLCRMMQKEDQSLWHSMIKMTDKKNVLELLEAGDILCMVVGSRGFRACVPIMPLVRIGTNGNEFAVFDLRFSPNEAAKAGVRRMLKDLGGRQAAVKIVRLNQQPILLSFPEYFKENSETKLSDREVLHRGKIVAEWVDLKERLRAGLEQDLTENIVSPFVEERVYDSFVLPSDARMMRSFHSATWSDRVKIADEFRDERWRELAWRQIFFERPNVLSDQLREKMEVWLTNRLMIKHSKVPWRTVGRAWDELERFRGGELGNSSLISEFQTFLLSVQQGLVDVR